MMFSAAVFQSHDGEVQLKEGTTRELSVPFYTHSDTPNVKVEWQKSGESTTLTSHREESTLVALTFYGQNHTINGTVTILTLSDVTEADGGNYTVTVTNVIEGVPQAKETTMFVTIQGSPGNGDGPKQGQGSGDPIGGIAGGVAGAVFLVIVTVVLVVFVRRRKMGAPGKAQTDDETKDIGTNGSPIVQQKHHGINDPCWSEPGAELVENDLYQTCDEVAVPRVTNPQNPPKPEKKKGKLKENGQAHAAADEFGSGASVVIRSNRAAKGKKKNGLTYAEVEFPKGTGEPNVHPRHDPVTYASIVAPEYQPTSSPGRPSRNNRSKKPGVTYAEVEISKGSGKPSDHPGQSPVTYASIRNMEQ